MKLGAITSFVRSKNAGPFILTFDIFCTDEASYLRVKSSGVLSADWFGQVFHCPPDEVRIFECDGIQAFKVSLPRPRVQGALGDADLHGGQQFPPILDLEVP